MSVFPKYERYKDSGVEWLLDVPEHWEVRSLRGVLKERGETNEGTKTDFILSVMKDRGVIPYTEKGNVGNKMSEDITTYKIVRPGDLVINKMNAIIGSLGISEYHGALSKVYFVLQPRYDYLNNRFYGYLFQIRDFQKSLSKISYGIMELRESINFNEFKNLPLPLPPKPEQDRIVAFLDQKTAEIEALIAKKQRQIELLDEQKAILINRAVTRGLNPNAKIKSSGIDWIGGIPEHWEVLQLRRLQRYGTSITYGIVQAGPDIEDGIPYIRTSDMKGTEFSHSGFLKTSHKIDNAYRRSKVEEGDLVIAIRATLGKALRVPKHLHGANLTQGTAKVAPGPRLDSKFLAYAFNSSYCQEAVLFVGKGTTFLEITLEALRRIQLVVPPMAEQIQIVGAIDRAVDLHRESVGLTLKEIQSLKSLRSTLIAHAVTGRIKVTSSHA